MRSRVTLPLDGRARLRRPSVPVRRLTLRPQRGMPPLEALVATPADTRGVLVYFPGFNTPLGEWEIAKCQFLAQASSLTVMVTEIPGMSRFGDPIPLAVRRDLLKRRMGAWTGLNLIYLTEALQAGEVENTEVMQVLGFSTGCSLAAAALPVLATWGPIEGLNLVEPVAITHRTVATLNTHNLADWGRWPLVYASNRHNEWVVQTRRRQSREPAVHYSAVDMLAIAQVLASETVMQGLEEVELARCALARGQLSSLCRPKDFEKLDARLTERGIPGPTIVVPGLGHQLWHSFPTLVALSLEMMGV